MSIPTFDEWHVSKYGASFDDINAVPNTRHDVYMLAFTAAVAQYTHEMLQKLANELMGGR